MHVKEALAQAAEKAAADYLEGCGFSILDLDWKCDGQIVSLIAADRRTVVVIELRVRVGTRHGRPLDAISTCRQQAMRRLAARWLAEHGRRADQIRIDVVGLLWDGSGGFTIEHVRAVG